VAAALATFKGSVKPVSVRAAQIRMLESVRDDNTLVIPLQPRVAQGKAVACACVPVVPVTPGASEARNVKPRFANGRFWTESVGTVNERSPLVD
jgi:hypothetical protein